MSQYKILVADGLDEEGLTLLRRAAEVSLQPQISASDLLEEIGNYDALVVRSRTKVTAAVVAAGKRLKVIGRSGVGVDNIDLIAAVEAGLTVVNSPLAATMAVAEMTMALLLGMARQVPAVDASMKVGKWEKQAFTGGELDGKVLGIVGYGRIGTQLARYATAFGMQVLVFSPSLTPKAIQESGVQSVELDELLSRADYLSLHVPFNETTCNLLGAAEFAKMKPGMRLVNTARGGIVDEEALRAALDSGQVTGAALDVFATEPVSPGSIAMHPRVIATPHIAAQTAEAQARAGIDIAEEVLAALQGETLRWKIC